MAPNKGGLGSQDIGFFFSGPDPRERSVHKHVEVRTKDPWIRLFLNNSAIPAAVCSHRPASASVAGQKVGSGTASQSGPRTQSPSKYNQNQNASRRQWKKGQQREAEEIGTTSDSGLKKPRRPASAPTHSGKRNFAVTEVDSDVAIMGLPVPPAVDDVLGGLPARIDPPLDALDILEMELGEKPRILNGKLHPSYRSRRCLGLSITRDPHMEELQSLRYRTEYSEAFKGDNVEKNAIPKAGTQRAVWGSGKAKFTNQSLGMYQSGRF